MIDHRPTPRAMAVAAGLEWLKQADARDVIAVALDKPILSGGTFIHLSSAACELRAAEIAVALQAAGWRLTRDNEWHE